MKTGQSFVSVYSGGLKPWLRAAWAHVWLLRIHSQ